MNGFAFGCAIAYLCTVFSRRYQQRSWQHESLSTSKTFKAMKQNRSPTKAAERRQNESVTYRVRIVTVSISYQSRIVLVSSFYRSPIVLASGSGNNTETIRKRYGNNRRSKGETRENAPNSKHFQIFKTLQLWQDSMVF